MFSAGIACSILYVFHLMLYTLFLGLLFINVPWQEMYLWGLTHAQDWFCCLVPWKSTLSCAVPLSMSFQSHLREFLCVCVCMDMCLPQESWGCFPSVYLYTNFLNVFMMENQQEAVGHLIKELTICCQLCIHLLYPACNGQFWMGCQPDITLTHIN